METTLNIALPKGRLGEAAYEMLRCAGCGCPQLEEGGRRLVFENAGKGLRYFWVKPSDVAIYVERGAADLGIVGRDILLEYGPEVYELLDLGIGHCRMVVAAPRGFRENREQTLRVATKFPNIARRHFVGKSREIDVIRLNGSIELAPLLGMSDVIVDIVETGKTLRENDLEPIEDIVSISARLISNRVSYRFKHEQVTALCRAVERSAK